MTRSVLIVLAASLLWSSGSAAGSSCSADGSSEASEPGQPASAARPDTAAGRTKPAVVRTDSALVFVPIESGNVFSRRFEENGARPLSTYLATSAREFYGIERYEMSKFECALSGADTGLTLGLIAGALGMMAGLWDERSAWYIAGAAAVLGAFRGVSKADDPAFSVRLRWEEDRRP